MSERKQGWYWVRGSETDGEWVLWEWIGESETLVARWADGGRRWIDEVGPRIPSPNEPWQAVPVVLTENMESAGCDAGATAYADADGIAMADAWAAMLAAAPNPEDE